MTDPQAKRILDTIDRVLQKKSAAPPPANDELRGMAEEFTPILKDIALEIIGAKSVVSSNLSDAKPENVLTRRVLPLLAQVAARARLEEHIKLCRRSVGSEWVCSKEHPCDRRAELQRGAS